MQFLHSTGLLIGLLTELLTEGDRGHPTSKVGERSVFSATIEDQVESSYAY
jgi:hypothetical protein